MALSVSFSPNELMALPVNCAKVLSPACSSIEPDSFNTNTELSLTFWVACPEEIIPTMLITPKMAMIMPNKRSPTIVANTYLKKSFIIFLGFLIAFVRKSSE